MKTRKCRKCKQAKDVAEFYSHNKNICKPCMIKHVCQWQKMNKEHINQWRRKYYVKNKNKLLQYSQKHRISKHEWLIQYKKAHPCEICGEADYRCLEFHHIIRRSTGEMPISAMVNYSIKQVKQEIKNKCQMLCANCHRKVHH